VKKIRPFVPLLFPILILFFGLIIYKILGYEPNLYTIIINIGLAFVLAPRVKKIQKQNGTAEPIIWLFYKKIWT
jgi:positive regulator of sigma E activity